MRENSRSNHIVMAMYRIGAPYEWNANTAITGISASLIKAITQSYPVSHSGILPIGPATTTIEHRAKIPITRLIWRHITYLCLYHLSNFLSSCH